FWASGAEAHRQLVQVVLRDDRLVAQLAGRNGQVEAGEAGVERRERHAGLQPGQGGAGADVRAVAEGDVPAGGLPGDVELTGRRTVRLLVAADRRVRHDQRVPGGQHLVADGHVLGGEPDQDVRGGGGPAQRLLDHR